VWRKFKFHTSNSVLSVFFPAIFSILIHLKGFPVYLLRIVGHFIPIFKCHFYLFFPNIKSTNICNINMTPNLTLPPTNLMPFIIIRLNSPPSSRGGDAGQGIQEFWANSPPHSPHPLIPRIPRSPYSTIPRLPASP
jgi:hypothetical protein